MCTYVEAMDYVYRGNGQCSLSSKDDKKCTSEGFLSTSFRAWEGLQGTNIKLSGVGSLRQHVRLGSVFGWHFTSAFRRRELAFLSVFRTSTISSSRRSLSPGKRLDINASLNCSNADNIGWKELCIQAAGPLIMLQDSCSTNQLYVLCGDFVHGGKCCPAV
jgi:hypothetical protein